MLKNSFRHFLKNSIIVHKISVLLVVIYLKFVYSTSKWNFIVYDGTDINDYKKKSENTGALFALWHNRLAFGMHIYKGYKSIYALASPHTDGQILTDVIRMMGFGVIEGSTNRNPTFALKEIIEKIKSGGNIVITPDGPRGPVYKVNSNITKIGYKYNKKVVPVSCSASKYFELSSWDKMKIPKPFGNITVNIGQAINLSGDSDADRKLLEETLNNLSK